MKAKSDCVSSVSESLVARGLMACFTTTTVLLCSQILIFATKHSATTPAQMDKRQLPQISLFSARSAR